TPGNGPDNAVRISVVAVNAIGESDPTQLPGTIWSDVIPPPPSAVTATPVDHGLRVVWRKPAATAGTPIDSYLVTVGGLTATVSVSADDAVGTEYTRIISNPGIANGAAVAFSVSARNKAPNSLATWNEAGGSATPAGAPILIASPTASASTTDGTTATIAWAGAFDANGKAISNYFVARHDGAAPACTVTGVDTGSPTLSPPTGDVQTLGGTAASATFTGLSANTTYTFTVYAYNGQGCTVSGSVTATPRAAPGDVAGIGLVGPLSSGTGTWDFRLTGFTIPSGSSDVDGFQYRLSGGTTDGSEYSGTPGAGFLTANGTQYGNSISVQVKACKQYPEVRLCSPNWSPVIGVGVPVRIEMSGLQAIETVPPVTALSPGQGYWVWTGGPTP
ncbi:fibronectin type III domain-containing protein, partial [Schumannella luteola]